MASRSRQAWKLTQHLQERADVTRVDLHWMGGAEWNLCWSDGPTEPQMLALVTEAVGWSEFAALADRVFQCTRSFSPQAWAATAVAMRRDPQRRAEIAAYAAGWRSRHGNDPRFNSDPDQMALSVLVEGTIKTTERPERVRAPEDEPLIAALLRIGRNSAGRSAPEYAMAQALCAVDRAPSTDQPPVLRLIKGETT